MCFIEMITTSTVWLIYSKGFTYYKAVIVCLKHSIAENIIVGLFCGLLVYLYVFLRWILTLAYLK